MATDPAAGYYIAFMHEGQKTDAAGVLSAAFIEDPIVGKYLLRQDAYKTAGMALFFALMFDMQYTVGPMSVVCQSSDGQVLGGAFWHAPDAEAGQVQGFSFSQMLRLALNAPSIYGWGGVWKALRLESIADSYHPSYRHYYLGHLAVHPMVSGKGIGQALLQPVLQLADRDQLPCYL